MFSLGFVGLFVISAIPLFVAYSLAALILKVAVLVLNRSSARVHFMVPTFTLVKVTCMIWALSEVLFFAFGYLDFHFTAYSGNQIFKAYWPVQQILCVAFFFLMLRANARDKLSGVGLSGRNVDVGSIIVAVVPALVFFIAANIWNVIRHHP